MSRAILLSRAAIETVILVLVCAAPWCYGAVHPGFELLLFAGVSLVLLLWAARMLLEGQLTWQKCPVALCLAGIFLLGVWQITPLPKSVLTWVSPGTSRLYDQLLPEQPESLPGEEARPSAVDVGATISLYPGATRMLLVRLLAVFLVFAAVRNNIASEAGLRRLAIAATINGAALSLFALVQFFSSPSNVLYWRYPSLGTVFGPFICRNHFSFYVNGCIGLALGLLLGRGAGSGKRAGGLRGILHDPASLWLCAALALMLGAVIFSLSRGGFLALAGAALVCFLLKRSQSARSSRGGALLLVAALAVLFAGWLGYGLIAERLATLWKGEAVQSRLPLWTRTAALVPEFPIWGTGYGTFGYAERLHQNTAQEAETAAEHAHNEYLEMLIEGGVPGFLLSLLAIGLVYWLGLRALRFGAARGTRRLALGALFGFTTLVIHSFGDFGLHIPAITLLATVLAAHLGALGGSRVRSEKTAPDVSEPSLRLGRLASLLGAGTIVALGLVLCAAGWQAHRIERLREAASRAGRGGGEENLAEQVAYLETAANMDSENAELQAELGQARLQLFEEKTGEQQRREELATLAGVVLAARGDWSTAMGWCVAGTGHTFPGPEQKRFARESLFPGLRNYLNARDRCPLLSEPHLVLATHVARFERADTRDAYLGRVKRLAGGDPEGWYLWGAAELGGKGHGASWARWRRCLELSDRHLPQLLAIASRELSPKDMVEVLLPDRPALLLDAAFRLYPEKGATSERRPFLQKAVRLLEGQPEE